MWSISQLVSISIIIFKYLEGTAVPRQILIVAKRHTDKPKNTLICTSATAIITKKHKNRNSHTNFQSLSFEFCSSFSAKIRRKLKTMLEGITRMFKIGKGTSGVWDIIGNQIYKYEIEWILSIFSRSLMVLNYILSFKIHYRFWRSPFPILEVNTFQFFRISFFYYFSREIDQR